MTNAINKGLWITSIIAIDLFAICTAAILGTLSNGQHVVFSAAYFSAMTPLNILMVMLIAYAGLYTKRLSLWREAKKLTVTVSFMFAIMVVFAGTYGDVHVGSLILDSIENWLIMIASIILWRAVGRKLLHAADIGRERVIIIGAGDMGTAVQSGFSKEKYMGYEAIGFIDDDPAKQGRIINGLKVIGNIDHFESILEEFRFDTVVIAIPSMPVAELVALTARIEKSTKKILLIPDLQGMPIMNTELRYLFSERLLMLRINNNLKSKIHITLKRVFDVVLSILLMPILLPALCIIGVFIKRESPGPVIFSHVRIGSGGKSVGVLKFRSMYVDAKERLEEILRTDPEAKAEWESGYKLKDDPRVTKIGRFLRETSLDELPQIFNVLIGEMSLVGPRPVIQDEIDKYYKEFAEYYFLTPPGITGLWQVSGRNDTSYDFRVKTDSWYASNWSLWLDLTILVKTAKVVLMREGAY